MFPTFGRIEVGGSGRTDDVEPGGGGGAGGNGGFDDNLSDDNFDDEHLDDESVDSNNNLNIVPFNNSKIEDDEKEEDDDEGLKGAVVATLSFIIKSNNTTSGNQYNKWEMLTLFIKNNLLLSIFSGMALLSLLIIYEIIAISRFRRSLSSQIP